MMLWEEGYPLLTKKEQQKVWALLDNKEKCLAYIEGIYDECTKGK